MSKLIDAKVTTTEQTNAILILATVMLPLSRAMHLMTPKEKFLFLQAQLIAGLAGIAGPEGYITTTQTQLSLVHAFTAPLLGSGKKVVAKMEESGVEVHSAETAAGKQLRGDALIIPTTIGKHGTRAVELTRASLSVYMSWITSVTLHCCGEIAGSKELDIPRDQRNGIVDQWVIIESHIALLKAKLFILDNELLNAIENTVVYPSDEPLELPFKSVWVEPAHRGAVDYGGWSFCDLYLMADNVRHAYRGMLKLRKKITTTANTYTVPNQSTWYAPEAYQGYDDDGIVLLTLGGEDLRTATETRMPLRIIKYLMSKNITYELQTRQYTGSSKVKRKNPPKPYHVTEVRNDYVLRIRDQIATGTGTKLDHRVSVQRHKVRYRYCPNCDKRRTIKELLKVEPCKECGTVTPLRNAKMIVKWRGPFEKGPDVDEQALRHLYRVRK